MGSTDPPWSDKHLMLKSLHNASIYRDENSYTQNILHMLHYIKYNITYIKNMGSYHCGLKRLFIVDCEWIKCCSILRINNRFYLCIKCCSTAWCLCVLLIDLNVYHCIHVCLWSILITSFKSFLLSVKCSVGWDILYVQEGSYVQIYA